MKSVIHLMAITVTVFASAQEINSNRSDQLLPSVDFTSTNFAPIHATYTSVTATPTMVSNSPTSSSPPVVTSTNVPWAATSIPSLAENAETGFVTSPQPISISPAQQTANPSHEPTATTERATVLVTATTNEYVKNTGNSTSPSCTVAYDRVQSASFQAIDSNGSPVSMRTTEVDENNEVYSITSPQLLVTNSPSQPTSVATVQQRSVPSVDFITTVESVRTATVTMIMPETASENVKETVYIAVSIPPTGATTPMITPTAISASTSPANPTATSQTPTPTAKPPGSEKGSAAEIIAAIVGVINVLLGKTLTIFCSAGTAAVGYVVYKRSTDTSDMLREKCVLASVMVTIWVAIFEASSSIGLAFEILGIIIAIGAGMYSFVFIVQLAYQPASMRYRSQSNADLEK